MISKALAECILFKLDTFETRVTSLQTLNQFVQELFRRKVFFFKSNFHAGVVVSISNRLFHPHETCVRSLNGEWVLCLGSVCFTPSIDIEISGTA